ncbi:MAG: tetratricopeptide repeat protein [Candidatus Eisenbacteria bacterium]|nr:tetratricopeptide repeat protein [Candidatus Eisenbacteria bacterium]MCC7141808.1 tetratricopeptide repeat protein [Candidatus Eisenbacteria bacterium]
MPEALPRSSRRLTAALLILLFAAGFLLLAGGESDRAARVYLSRAAAAQHALPVGLEESRYPAWTAPVSALIAPIQTIGFWQARGSLGARGVYLETTRPRWVFTLRLLFAGLAGLSAWLLLDLYARLRGTRANLWSALAVAIGAAPVFSAGVRGLSPSLIAIPLLLLLLREGVAESDHPRSFRWSGARVAGWSGALLAWTPFAWPGAVILFLFAMRDRSARRGMLLAGAVTLGLALALEPRHLVALGALPATWSADWMREGGFALSARPFRNPMLLLLRDTLGLAAPVWIGLLLLGAIRFRTAGGVRDTTRAALALLGGLVLLPVASGVTTSGAAQASAAPFVLLGAVLTVSRWAERLGLPSRRALIPVLALLGALPLVSLERGGTRPRPDSIAAELARMIGPDSLWLAERELPGGEPAPGQAWIPPRDSRRPERFDFAWWDRWYSGFRFVLLSGAQVKQNLERPEAAVPRHLYRRVEAEGTLLRQWGQGSEGYRLYRMPARGSWARSLRESELDSLRANPDLLAFMNELATRYIAAGKRQEGATLLRAGLRFDPERAGLWNNLGLVYLADRDFRAAGAAFDEGLKREPRSVELLYNAGRTYIELGSPARAERTLRLALAFKPDLAPLHYEIARAFEAQGRRKLAQDALRRFLSLDPDTPRRTMVEGAIRALETENQPVAPDSSASLPAAAESP